MKFIQKDGLKMPPNYEYINLSCFSIKRVDSQCADKTGEFSVMLPNSFPASLIFPPSGAREGGGGKMRDAGNEVIMLPVMKLRQVFPIYFSSFLLFPMTTLLQLGVCEHLTNTLHRLQI